MSSNIKQIADAVPITSVLGTDLIYLGRSPFAASDDRAISATNFFITSLPAKFTLATLSNVTNQLVLGTTNTTTINATAPASSSIYTIPDVGTSANFVMTAGTQSIGGSKSFSSAIAITATSNHIALSSPVGTATLSVINQSLGSFVYSIPNVGANANFVMTESTQTINGAKTFGANTSVSYSNAGADVILLVQNGSTSTGSNSIINNYVNNSGTGNAVYRCGHAAAQKYSWGFDNDDSDAWVFSVGDTLGTNNAMRCSTAGNFSFNNALTVNADISQTISTAATDITLTTSNTSGTGPTVISHQLLANNSNAGTQAFVKVGHQGAQQYTFGWTRVDNNFQLSVGGTLGTANAWTVDQNGAFTFNNASVSQTASNSGAAVAMVITNSSNTASSDARLTVAVGGTSGGDAYHLFSIPSGTSYTMGADNSDSDAFALSVGTALGTSNALRCDSSGRFTYPTQPRFRASKSSTTTNATGDGTQVVIVFDTETFDVGGNYDNTTGTFTAPVTATYRFDVSTTFSSVGAGHNISAQDILINSSTVVATMSGANPGNGRDSSNLFMLAQASRMMNLTAGDTITVRVAVGGSTKTVGILGNAFFSTIFNGIMVA